MIIFYRHIHSLAILTVLLAAPLMPSTCLHAEELEMVNRPINSNGLTGLLYTTTPYTLAPGVVETGFASISEESVIPAYTLNESSAVIAAGIGHDMELAVSSSYFSRQTGTSSIQKTRGSGNMEVLSKWNFMPQQEDSSAPVMALLLTVIFPSSDNKSGFTQVRNWGARIGLSAGSEIAWEEHILGIYADASLAVQDLSDSRYRDRFGCMNAGLLLPISKQRNLQLFLEYGFVGGKRVVTVSGLDYTAITYGLRMVNERLNLTIGAQFQNKDISGYSDSGKIVGMGSIKF